MAPQRWRLPAGSTVLVIGSGPIVIGQACEFDYSGTQACKALAALGYRVVLMNSNPATIMTDEDLAAATYVEPLTLDAARQVIERERPDALLPTVGGQVALNLALELFDAGILERHGVRLIGADPQAIRVAEDRQRFKDAMVEIGVGVAESGTATTLQEAEVLLEQVKLPAIIRPSFTLGGAGGGIAWNVDEFRAIVTEGLRLSPTSQVLVERSLLGWKEFELEVMRDLADNVIIICSIENFDPMGVHTGDSITVAPALTLTDVEYQHLRDLSRKIIRRIGVETGGSNIQFAVNPENGEVIVIEMNPRVSRSSALASKATGFPIAKIAAQLAVGLTLDEIPNDITRVTPACFEPALDYVIVKIPRWNFEKFQGTNRTLGTAMRSVGEVMGIGRTFQEACLKAIDSLEGGYAETGGLADQPLREALATPTPDRLSAIFEALRRGWSSSEISDLTRIDRWFLDQLEDIVRFEQSLTGRFIDQVSTAELRRAKRMGISDAMLAKLLGCREESVARRRASEGLRPVYKRVDTCAAEFESHTPYLYSTWEDEDEAGDSVSDRVVILGNGPNRIGQGLEFDYCCCHAAYAVREAGLTSVMVNCNPETVSTDYDTSDKLYFEPCTIEHVRSILEREKPRGVILQFGGQTPLKLAHQVGPVLGTSPEAIDLCEDRERFAAFLRTLGIPQPESAVAHSVPEAVEHAVRLGFPLLVRPSYVLGGRAMAICYDQSDFDRVVGDAIATSEAKSLLIDRYLEGAREYDVDALCDGEQVVIGGIVEHIEEAGVHSGDSAGVLPPVQLTDGERQKLVEHTTRIALALGVVGLVNIQFAIQGDQVSVLEVNPRASRTVPFVAKATGVPLAKIATRLCLGEKLADLDLKPKGADLYFIKAPVFPWQKFAGHDVVLGPEMRSTGEVMGVGWSFGEAYAKALIAAGMKLPTQGGVFLSIRDSDKAVSVAIAGALAHMGFKLYATRGTARFLAEKGIACEPVYKVREGRPDAVDLIKNGDIHLILNTPLGRKAQYDEMAMRLAGLQQGIACITNLSAAKAAVSAIRSLRAGELRVIKLQEISQVLLVLEILGAIAGYELVRWTFVRQVRKSWGKSATRFVRKHRIRLESARFIDRVWIREALAQDPRIENAIAGLAGQGARSVRELRTQVDAYVEEIAPFFSLSAYYRLGPMLAKRVVDFCFELVFSPGAFDAQLAKVPPDVVRVYVINHRANMDPLILAYGLLRHVPMSYAVGEWALVWPLHTLFRAFGSYFVRRGEKDPLYHAVLERFVQLLAGQGAVTGFFPEGALSRDGALRKPRTGLLEYIIGLRHDHPDQDIAFMPVGLNYDRVLEDRYLMADTAKPTRKQAFLERVGRLAGVVVWVPRLVIANLLRVATRSHQKFGYAALSFGEPLLLSDWPGGLGLHLLPAEERKLGVEALADELLNRRIGPVVPATPVPIYATAVLREGPTDDASIRRRVREVLAELRAHGAPLALGRAFDEFRRKREPEERPGIHPAFDEALLDDEEAERVASLASTLLLRRRLVRKVVTPAGPGHETHAPDAEAVLQYYANSIRHHWAVGA